MQGSAHPKTGQGKQRWGTAPAWSPVLVSCTPQARLHRGSPGLPYPQPNPSLLNLRPSGGQFMWQGPEGAARQCPVLLGQPSWVFSCWVGNALAATSKRILSAVGQKREKCLFLWWGGSVWVCPGNQNVMRTGSDHLGNGFGGGCSNPAAPRRSQTMPGTGSGDSAGDKGRGMELLRVCGFCFTEGPGKDVAIRSHCPERGEPKCSPGALQGGPAPALGTGTVHSTGKVPELQTQSSVSRLAGGSGMEEPRGGFSPAGLLETP